jgi:hypothetical protein
MEDSQKLQKLIDQYIYSEDGAEIVLNAGDVLGALADFVLDPHTKHTGFVLLMPPEVMGYDQPKGFVLHDWLHQKDKEHDRLVLRSVTGNIFVIQPPSTARTRYDVAFYPMDEETREATRAILLGFVRSI